jgi:hypothetical protein
VLHRAVIGHRRAAQRDRVEQQIAGDGISVFALVVDVDRAVPDHEVVGAEPVVVVVEAAEG